MAVSEQDVMAAKEAEEEAQRMTFSEEIMNAVDDAMSRRMYETSKAHVSKADRHNFRPRLDARSQAALCMGLAAQVKVIWPEKGTPEAIVVDSTTLDEQTAKALAEPDKDALTELKKLMESKAMAELVLGDAEEVDEDVHLDRQAFWRLQQHVQAP